MVRHGRYFTAQTAYHLQMEKPKHSMSRRLVFTVSIAGALLLAARCARLQKQEFFPNMNVNDLEGTLTATSAEESVSVRYVGDEPYKRAVKGWPRTLIVVFHAWSSNMNELDNYPLLASLNNYVMVCPNAGGINFHPQGAGHPSQLERINRVIESIKAEFPMIERVIGIGTSGGGYLGLMYMAAYPGVLYGGLFWVFPFDLADWWLQKPQFRESLEACMGGTPSQVPNEYFSRSPLSKSISGAVIYLNGSPEDVQVPFYQQEQARDRFAQGNTLTFRSFPGGHITQWDVAVSQMQAMYPT